MNNSCAGHCERTCSIIFTSRYIWIHRRWFRDPTDVVPPLVPYTGAISFSLSPSEVLVRQRSCLVHFSNRVVLLLMGKNSYIVICYCNASYLWCLIYDYCSDKLKVVRKCMALKMYHTPTRQKSLSKTNGVKTWWLTQSSFGHCSLPFGGKKMFVLDLQQIHNYCITWSSQLENTNRRKRLFQG